MCAPTSAVILKLYFLCSRDFLHFALLLNDSNFLDRTKNKVLVLMRPYVLYKNNIAIFFPIRAAPHFICVAAFLLSATKFYKPSLLV